MIRTIINQNIRSGGNVLRSRHHNYNNSHIHPATIAKGIRCHYHRIHNQYRHYHNNQFTHNNEYLYATCIRWKRNIKRLYARRVMEILVASALSQRLLMTTTMEQRKEFEEFAVSQPSEWANFEHKDWTDELLQCIGSTKLQRLWKATKRMVTLGTLLSPLAVLVPLSEYVSPTVFKPIMYDYAIWSVEQAGPTLIKLIQWATTRQDLFSQEFCSHFAKLQDDTAGHTWEETERILRDDVGPNYKDYISLHPKPIGSGCIAQVYQGKLLKPTKCHKKGTKIAIKVQHPGIWEKVCTDFYILAKAAKWLEAAPYLGLEYLALVDTVEQFRNVMLPQLDLTLEAKHLQRFNRDFSNDETVSFPFPIHELTSKNVLVETFIHGKPILDYVDAPENLRKQIALLGIKTTLKMIFLNDFVHGDLHPGNILVSEHTDAAEANEIVENEHENNKAAKQQQDVISQVTSAFNSLLDTITSLLFTGDTNYTTTKAPDDNNKNSNNESATTTTTTKTEKNWDAIKQLRLHLLDCGIVIEMGPQQHIDLVRILGALTRRDGLLAGQLMVDTSRNSKFATSLDVETFIGGIEQICQDDEENNFLEKIGDYITDICYLACKHKVKLEGTFISAALAVEIMEGIAQAMYKELRVQEHAVPIVMQAELMHRLSNAKLPW